MCVVRYFVNRAPELVQGRAACLSEIKQGCSHWQWCWQKQIHLLLSTVTITSWSELQFCWHFWLRIPPVSVLCFYIVWCLVRNVLSMQCGVQWLCCRWRDALYPTWRCEVSSSGRHSSQVHASVGHCMLPCCLMHMYDCQWINCCTLLLPYRAVHNFEQFQCCYQDQAPQGHN